MRLLVIMLDDLHAYPDIQHPTRKQCLSYNSPIWLRSQTMHGCQRSYRATALRTCMKSLHAMTRFSTGIAAL